MSIIKRINFKAARTALLITMGIVLSISILAFIISLIPFKIIAISMGIYFVCAIFLIAYGIINENDKEKNESKEEIKKEGETT